MKKQKMRLRREEQKLQGEQCRTEHSKIKVYHNANSLIGERGSGVKNKQLMKQLEHIFQNQRSNDFLAAPSQEAVHPFAQTYINQLLGTRQNSGSQICLSPSPFDRRQKSSDQIS